MKKFGIRPFYRTDSIRIIKSVASHFTLLIHRVPLHPNRSRTMLNPLVLLVWTSTILSLIVFSSPLGRNRTKDLCDCETFCASIYAETDNNIDLASVIG